MPYLLIPFSLLFCVYIFLEDTYRFWLATAAKLILTATLAACLWSKVLQGNFSPVKLLFAVGMTSAIVGDYFLQYIQKDNRKFVTGIFFFAATHLCYLPALHLLFPARWWHLISLAVCVGIVLVLKLGGHWDTSAADPWLSVYTVFVAATAAKGITMLFEGPLPAGGNVLALGCILFFLSDVVLGIWNYQKTHIALANLNWLFYFGGQFCIAAGVITML